MRKALKSAHPLAKKLLLSAALAFVAAYIFGSLAIDRGNWFYYGLTLAAVYYGFRSLWRGLNHLKK